MNWQLSRNKRWRAVCSFACLLAMAATLGGHWMMLQSFAWARMLSQAAQRDSWGVAVTKTFDGHHPCELCLAIQKGRNSEKKSDQEKPPLKLEGLLAENWWLPRPVAAYPRISASWKFMDGWSEPPPIPPPRLA
jgi:hypothetical protein